MREMSPRELALLKRKGVPVVSKTKKEIPKKEENVVGKHIQSMADRAEKLSLEIAGVQMATSEQITEVNGAAQENIMALSESLKAALEKGKVQSLKVIRTKAGLIDEVKFIYK